MFAIVENDNYTPYSFHKVKYVCYDCGCVDKVSKERFQRLLDGSASCRCMHRLKLRQSQWNRGNTRRVYLFGEELSLHELGFLANVSITLLKTRLKRGETVEEAAFGHKAAKNYSGWLNNYGKEREPKHFLATQPL